MAMYKLDRARGGRFNRNDMGLLRGALSLSFVIDNSEDADKAVVVASVGSNSAVPAEVANVRRVEAVSCDDKAGSSRGELIELRWNVSHRVAFVFLALLQNAAEGCNLG